MGKVNYLVELHDRQKQKRIYHINLLKKWETPITDCYAAEESAEGEEEDIPDWRPQQGSDKPNIGQQLTEQQREEMEELISEFQDVLQGKPGQTTLTRHSIHTGASLPVRLAHTGFLMLIVKLWRKSYKK